MDVLERARAFKHREGTADIELNASKRKDGHSIDSLMKRRTVLLTLIAIMLVVPAMLLSGCTTGQVVAPFNPKPVKPEPYNPEPIWSDKSDTTLASIQSFKQQTGQTVAPGGTGAAGTSGTSGGLIPGGTTGGTPTPNPGPAPAPAPAPSHIPVPTDPVYGVVTDRIEGGAIPNATITLTERRGGGVASTVTTATGEYSFTNLAVGYYRVSAAADGYALSPLSTVDFNYFGVPVVANLELVYNNPWQIIEGGNFSALGNVGYMISDGNITDPPPKDELSPTVVRPNVTQNFEFQYMNAGGQTDAMKTQFYSLSPQQTYDALKIDNIHGNWTELPGNIYSDDVLKDANGWPLLQYQTGGSIGTVNSSMWNLANYTVGTKDKTYLDALGDPIPYLFGFQADPWAEYDFTVPAPVANSYSYDGLWVTFPGNWKINAQSNIWEKGGACRFWYYDWHDGVWYYLGATDTNTVGYVHFSGVNPLTGRVSLRAAAFDFNPFVITQIRLAYDYRKDVAAPTFYEQYYHKSWDGASSTGSVYWTVKLQEEGFVTVNLSGPVNRTRTMKYYSGDVWDVPAASGLPAGSYSYTITTADLPGNTHTYGPYTFSLP